jgi:endonuclease YncB( thermonuclease family)
MYEYHAVIRSIYDADTCRADIDLGFGIWTANQSIRLYGIDAPELGTPEGRVARDYLRTLMPVGSTVLLRTHKDEAEKYGRWLGQIWLHDGDVLSINQQLVDTGHAKPYDGGAR